MVNRDVKFDKDRWLSSFEELLIEIVRGEKMADLKSSPKDKLDLDSDQQDPSSEGEDLLPLSLARKLRWITHTLKEAEQVGALESTFQVSHPPRIYPSYVALMSSIIDVESFQL
jgi:hypothetical protein